MEISIQCHNDPFVLLRTFNDHYIFGGSQANFTSVNGVNTSIPQQRCSRARQSLIKQQFHTETR
jgi:hypothetical protein